MTGTEMLSSLGYRVEDTGHVNFTTDQKLQALNDAQTQVVSMCSNEVLVHLQTSRAMGAAQTDSTLNSLKYFNLPTSSVILTDVTATADDPTVFTKTSHGLADGDIVKLYSFTQMTEINGMTGTVNELNSSTFEINGVAADPAETSIAPDLGGTVEKLETSLIRVVNVFDDTNNRFVELVPMENLGANTSYSYGTKGSFFNNKLYVSAATAVADCTMVYISSPPKITNTAVEVTHLSEPIQLAVIEGAESFLWRQDNRINRATAASTNAMGLVTAVNEQGI